MGLSLRAYARHRAGRNLPGGTLRAVQLAARAGRITLDADGSVGDPERADAEWAANTDHTKAPGPVKAKAVAAAGANMPPQTGGPATLPEENARKAHWQANQAELDYRKAAGELVPAAEVEAAVSGAFLRCRTKLMGIPSRMRQQFPELTPAVVAGLEELVRESCEELATTAEEETEG